MTKTKLNAALLADVSKHFRKTAAIKRAFVPMDQGGPPMDPGMDPGMDPAMMGGMPPGMPPGMDPAMMGGMEGMPPGADPMMGVDPMMMGGMPPGLDPAMAGMVGGGPMMDPGMVPDANGAPQGAGSSTVTLTIDELLKLLRAFKGVPDTQSVAQPSSNETDQDIKEILTLLRTAVGGR